MDHKEIRFRILFKLYMKHYDGKARQPQVTDTLIKEAGLEYVDKDLIDGDMVYLKDSGRIAGQGMIEGIYITLDGIDEVDKTIRKILNFLECTEKYKKYHPNIIAIPSQKARIDTMWGIFEKNEPDLLKEFFKSSISL